MKNSLILVLIFVSFHLFSQTNVYHPFPDSNSVWTEQCAYLQGGMTPVNNPQILFLGGDTVISAVIYKKILTSGYKYYLYPGNNCCLYYNQLAGMIRQDTAQKKIYSWIPPTDVLLYDFNLYAGDTLPVSSINYPGSGNYVSSIDSILVGTTYRKRFHISVKGSISAWDSNYVQLIEGIGSTFGLLSPLSPPFEGGCNLNCFSENNIVLYPSSASSCDIGLGILEDKNLLDDVSIHPNPSTGFYQINSSEKFQYSVFDVVGRKFFESTNLQNQSNLDLSAYPKGVYFVRGKSGNKIFSRKIILQ
jgi:hypothetical protein